MKRNLLVEWRNECYVLSSPLSINKRIERTDVDSIFKTLSDYFGVEYFDTEANNSPSDVDNWLYCLLANSKKLACIVALYEVAYLLDYTQTLNKSTQKKFKSLFNDPRQFRDMLFEVYVRQALEYNNISCEKHPKEGSKPLDIVCTIDDRKFLCECRKIYSPNINLIHTEVHLMRTLYVQIQKMNKGFGVIGTMRFKDINSGKLKEIFEGKITRFVEGFNKHSLRSIDYHDVDKDGELHVVDYSDPNNIEIENSFSQHHIVFKIIPPFTSIPDVANRYRVELKANFDVPQRKITNKLFSAIRGKNEQHAASMYEKKIYFIDSETIPDFNMPIFRVESMFEEDKIRKFIESFSENEFFCFIRREYVDSLPKVSIKVLGKNIDDKIKNLLENLEMNFAYDIVESDPICGLASIRRKIPNLDSTSRSP
ncbi:hypothetical protein [Tunicatimonas pelagia]|uniref:hypothetical protein n=1 Tax=Tunicatimonas pelagia TaxID=931531 RepID=UPI0026656C95|nr:hypothetical protein [Tunicatimonas pelagia]WKN42424.1 hypothetical protein P0M28_25645 [Tunicatimonas pelagia]